LYPAEKAVIFDDRLVAPEPTSPPDGIPAPSQVGRLKSHINQWRSAMEQIDDLCSFTLSVIQNGYQPE